MVYYDASLWSKNKGLCGLRQRTNWQFEYAGAKRYIPAVYRFSKGIVFDLLTILDEKKLQEYFEKYEAIEEKLTPLQRRCAKQEHPYVAVPIKEIWINGTRVKSSYSSSSAVSIPWAGQNDNLTPVRKTYSSILKDTLCFACERFCVPYPETGSKIQKLLRFLRQDRVNSIKLLTHSLQWFYPLNISFKMSEKDKQKEVCFRHPITEITHALYFQDAKSVEIALGSGVRRSLYTMQSMYEIVPSLPEGDTLQFNSSLQSTEPSEDKFKPLAASSIGIIGASAIGIIGGADGPTTLLHNCFSVPSYNKDDTSQFLLEGINIRKIDSKEYYFE